MLSGVVGLSGWWVMADGKPAALALTLAVWPDMNLVVMIGSA